ncbi:hypothetical protein B1J93_19395 [Leptospira kirschneri serovar Pomona]|uniref:Uncharacterized protein n=1 Tax=Leptospira kirschneri serovar Pomona TaxID=561005 RepID=A0A1T1DFX8_9LEPT|nr:hypothetical protein AYB34_04625 [Leptospira sp. ZV016]OOV39771.1 hypothetical protein B1J93_19395 [Leptospira kirschneri serovar Pomona]
MNELKHNFFLKLNASLLKGRSGNSASHSPWVVRQVALETQHNAFYESVVGSSYWYFMKIESDSIVSQ